MASSITSFFTAPTPASTPVDVTASPPRIRKMTPEERESHVDAMFRGASLVQQEIWLREMPKGADIHLHLSGGIHYDKLYRWANKYNLFYDPVKGVFSQTNHDGFIPAKDLPNNPEMYEKFCNDASLRAYSVVNQQTGHDLFMYKSFSVIGSILNVVPLEKQVKWMLKTCKRQNINYLELMVSLNALKQMTGSVERKEGDPVVRYIVEISRKQPDDAVFEEQVREAVKLIKDNPDIVSFNIVGPEDNPISQQHFKAQIAIIDRIWRETVPQIPLTLHGGELGSHLCSSDYSSTRIQETHIEGVKRMGHAASIDLETNAQQLVDDIVGRKTALEICLTSNERLLHLVGERHPLNWYIENGVPIVLCSDDPGVSLADLTAQYVIAMTRHHLSYKTIKEINGNGLGFSFLPGESIFVDQNTRELKPLFRGLDDDHWVPTPEVEAFLKSSEKATLQVKLERALVNFEMKLVGRCY